jgi:hypothetical protein
MVSTQVKKQARSNATAAAMGQFFVAPMKRLLRFTWRVAVLAEGSAFC